MSSRNCCLAFADINWYVDNRIPPPPLPSDKVQNEKCVVQLIIAAGLIDFPGRDEVRLRTNR